MPNHLSTHLTSQPKKTKPLHLQTKKQPPRKGWGEEKSREEEKSGAGEVEMRGVGRRVEG
jgi:hypothetical protein